MEKFKLWLYDVWVWIASWFEDHKRLYITHNQYNADGEIIDVLEKSFDVRKFRKISAKHMKFKRIQGKEVEIKTNNPMDYMLEDLD